jgi:hypothetical protein
MTTADGNTILYNTREHADSPRNNLTVSAVFGFDTRGQPDNLVVYE